MKLKIKIKLKVKVWLKYLREAALVTHIRDINRHKIEKSTKNALKSN